MRGLEPSFGGTIGLPEKVPGIETAVEKLVTTMIQKNPTTRIATWNHVMVGVAHAGASFAAALVMTKPDALEGIEQTLAESGAPPLRELLAMFGAPLPEGANEVERPALPANVLPSSSPSPSPQSPSPLPEAAPGPTPPPSPPPPAQPNPRRRARAAFVPLLALLSVLLGLGVSLLLLPRAPECASPAPFAMLLGPLALPEPVGSPPVALAPSASLPPRPASTLLPARTVGRARAPGSDVQQGSPRTDPCRDKYPDFWRCTQMRPKSQRRE